MPELHDRLTASAALAALLAGVPARRRLVIGVSGGVDSMLLLALVREFSAQQLPTPLPILAVHVHHGLSPHADDWAREVERVCTVIGVTPVVSQVKVDRTLPSLESAARAARHAAFAAVLQPGDALLLAHHADDQAETVLLRLLRGTGLTGLGAMRPARPWPELDDVWLLRPLLDVSRAAIEREAVRRKLAWIEDESNADIAHNRNFLRHKIFPQLRARWPALVSILADTARRLADTDTLLNEYLDVDLAALLVGSADERKDSRAALNVEGLCAQAPLRQRALLRRWLARIGAPAFYEAWLDELLKIARSQRDAEGELRVGGWEFHRFRGQLVAFPELPPLPADDGERPLTWDLQGTLDLGAGSGRLIAVADRVADNIADNDTDAGLALVLPAGSLATVRFRAGGERLNPAGGIGSRPLKKVLQEQGLPPWLRSRVPLLYVDNQLAAVGDLVVDAAFAPGHGQLATVWLHWIRP